MKHLPIERALNLCKDYYEVCRLWDRAIAMEEKQAVLNRIVDLMARQPLDEYSLPSYYNLTADFPAERKIATALLNVYIATNGKTSMSLAGKVALSEIQIDGICHSILSKDDKNIYMYDVLSFFWKTRSPIVRNLIIVLLGMAQYSNERLDFLNWITQILSDSSEKNRTQDILLLFPLVSAIVEEAEISKLSDWRKVIEILPPYDEGNPDIRMVINRTNHYYNSRPYPMSADDFQVLYAYAPLRDWTAFFIKRIDGNGGVHFPSVQRVFEICKDVKIVKAAIDRGIPVLKYATEDFNNFLDWLQKTNLYLGDLPLYDLALVAIIVGKNLEIWGLDFIKNGFSRTSYLRLLSHFL